MHQIKKPFLQFFTGKSLIKTLYFLCLHLTVGHLYSDFRKFLYAGIYIGIALCLGQMHLLRFFDQIQILQDSLDFIHCGPAILLNNSVRSSLHYNIQFLTRHDNLKRHLRMISASHLSLNFPMNPSPKQHGLLIRCASLSAVQISLS